MRQAGVFHSTGVKAGKVTWVFNIIALFIITVIAILCLIPFMLLLSGSFSSDQAIRFSGYSLLPRDFTLEAYSMVFKHPQKIFMAYGVSVFITSAGTFCGLFLITMTAYVISRKSFKYRNAFSFLFYFTTLFNGGLVCSYILFIRYLHLKDSFLALILPGMFNVFYLLIMRSFVSAIPQALIESAKIDGAGEFKIFVRIILPLLPSGLATIGLFMALGYWNDWYNAMLYIQTPEKFPLQYMMYDILMRSQALLQIASYVGIRMENLPTNSLKLAMAVVTTGPIVLLYPFVQKYFVKGVTIGSVKG
ncbi:MAG: carbohydrate ABC transporter permease [Treponema sp.]|jgi:putative aldouronate transport system permease protein|nr:carbohydrate ABC transporter permease [Treponema sp.]